MIGGRGTSFFRWRRPLSCCTRGANGSSPGQESKTAQSLIETIASLSGSVKETGGAKKKNEKALQATFEGDKFKNIEEGHPFKFVLLKRNFQAVVKTKYQTFMVREWHSSNRSFF